MMVTQANTLELIFKIFYSHDPYLDSYFKDKSAERRAARNSSHSINNIAFNNLLYVYRY